MYSITKSDWDSAQFGVCAGYIKNPEIIPTREQLAEYDFISIKIPQDNLALVWEYEALGFRFVALDNRLIYEQTRSINKNNIQKRNDYKIIVIKKSLPEFEVRGFNVEHSRLMLDPVCRAWLSNNYWDDVIRSHCQEYADLCFCSKSNDNQLEGFVSCFERENELEIFLFMIHPAHQFNGLGKLIGSEVIRHSSNSDKLLSTSVISSNIAAINFYNKLGFIFESSSYVMHFSSNL